MALSRLVLLLAVVHVALAVVCDVNNPANPYRDRLDRNYQSLRNERHNWMEQVRAQAGAAVVPPIGPPVANPWDALTLKTISVPGSHDAATWRGDLLGTPTPKSWAVTQTKTIIDQLCLGVRWFDIRFKQTGGVWRAWHGGAKDFFFAPLQTIANEFRDFAAEHPFELTTVRIKSSPSGQLRNVINTFLTLLNPVGVAPAIPIVHLPVAAVAGVGIPYAAAPVPLPANFFVVRSTIGMQASGTAGTLGDVPLRTLHQAGRLIIARYLDAHNGPGSIMLPAPPIGAAIENDLTWLYNKHLATSNWAGDFSGQNSVHDMYYKTNVGQLAKYTAWRAQAAGNRKIFALWWTSYSGKVLKAVRAFWKRKNWPVTLNGNPALGGYTLRTPFDMLAQAQQGCPGGNIIVSDAGGDIVTADAFRWARQYTLDVLGLGGGAAADHCAGAVPGGQVAVNFLETELAIDKLDAQVARIGRGLESDEVDGDEGEVDAASLHVPVQPVTPPSPHHGRLTYRPTILPKAQTQSQSQSQTQSTQTLASRFAQQQRFREQASGKNALQPEMETLNGNLEREEEEGEEQGEGNENQNQNVNDEQDQEEEAPTVRFTEVELPDGESAYKADQPFVETPEIANAATPPEKAPTTSAVCKLCVDNGPDPDFEDVEDDAPASDSASKDASSVPCCNTCDVGVPNKQGCCVICFEEMLEDWKDGDAPCCSLAPESQDSASVPTPPPVKKT